jgi:hypothetical protein
MCRDGRAVTHSGGKPHHVGDRGQRYEVSFEDVGGKRMVFGWSDDMAGAERMMASIRLHPTWVQPAVRDRSADGTATKS